MYTGDYAHYEQEKEARIALLEQAYRDQQKDIKQKQETINRFRASASKAKMAQSMIKQLEKIELIVLPPSPRIMSILVSPTQRSAPHCADRQQCKSAFWLSQDFKNV